METKHRPFIDLDKQIEKLEYRGLIIEDKDLAKKQLIWTSYYDLINGYKDMFLVDHCNDEDKYIEGTTLDDVLNLYNLDRKLRHTTLALLLDIECNFYSSLAYSLSKVYGDRHKDYLSTDKYKQGVRQSHNGKFERENLLNKINSIIDSPKHQPLIHYKEEYNNIPPWILVKGLTFGQLVMLYKLSSSEVKEMVIKNLTNTEATDDIKEYFLISMKLFNKLRNWAAHGGRLYNYRPNIDMPYDKIIQEVLHIDKKDWKKGNGKNDFASFINSILFFFQYNYSGIIEFLVYVHSALDIYKDENPLRYEKLLNELGLPTNYYVNILTHMNLKKGPSK